MGGPAAPRCKLQLSFTGGYTIHNAPPRLCAFSEYTRAPAVRPTPAWASAWASVQRSMSHAQTSGRSTAESSHAPTQPPTLNPRNHTHDTAQRHPGRRREGRTGSGHCDRTQSMWYIPMHGPIMTWFMYRYRECSRSSSTPSQHHGVMQHGHTSHHLSPRSHRPSGAWIITNRAPNPARFPRLHATATGIRGSWPRVASPREVHFESVRQAEARRRDEHAPNAPRPASPASPATRACPPAEATSGPAVAS